MATKTRNRILITLITLATIIFSLLFVPGFFTQSLAVRYYWDYTWGTNYTYFVPPAQPDKLVSFVNTFESLDHAKEDYKLLTAAICISVLACIALFIVQYFVKSKANWIVAAFSPIIPIILLCIYTPILNECCGPQENSTSYEIYKISYLFVFVLFLLFVLLAISVISYFIIRNDGVVEYVADELITTSSTAQESADECFWCNGTGMSEDANGKLHRCLHCHGTGKQQ